MPSGGKRKNSGRKPFTPDFLNWVWTEVTARVANTGYERFKSRQSTRKNIRHLQSEFIESEGHDLERTLDVAEAWRDGYDGEALFERVGQSTGTSRIFVPGEAIPKPIPSEMSRIFAKVASDGKKKWSVISPAIVKRAWSKSRLELRSLPKGDPDYIPQINAHPDED